MSARTDSPFDTCLVEALVLTRGWVPRWLGKLLETLHQRETSASNLNEKQVFSQARTVLASHRDLLAGRFIAEISQVVQHSSATQKNAATARSLKSLSFDDLELMDHQQVQETVERARVQQVIKMAAEEELVAFNARLCRAQGHEVVRNETNPLRPEAVVGALMKALSGLHVDEAVRALWLHVGAVSLGNELQQFYRSLTMLLDGMGVQPAGYVVVQAAKARPAASVAPSAARPDSVSATAMLGNDALLTLDHLHQLLVGNLEHSDGAASDQGMSGSGNAMVRTLAAEVVTLMLRRIAEDQRLLQPVRDMVQRLKPALLQLARTDPRFFADRHNPARRLLDAITTQSLAFTSEQDRGFMAYAQRVHETVMALQAPTQSLPELMPVLLQRFTDSDVAWWDALPTALSLVGQALLGRKYIENWLIWLVVNTISVALFAYKGLWLTCVLYALFAAMSVLPVADYSEELLATLRSVSFSDGHEPNVVLLTPGHYNSAYFEHAFLAQQMGVELVEGQDLFVKDNFVYMRTTKGPRRVDVIYRRVDDDFLDPLVFRPSSTLGCAGLLGVYRSGNVTICNAVGTGIADDKSIYPYVPKMIEFYLGQKPILNNVPTFMGRNPDDLKYMLDNMAELVVKEVHGAGGYGMLVGPASTKAEIEEFRAVVRAHPGGYIAQPTLSLSTCPTYVESGVAPRHIDLRPFVLSGKEVQMVPGGLTRVALKEGSLVVNSSQGGGTKDTWILED